MNNLTSNIINVQRFSLNDGPGIRTTVFFKGCSLRCPWCHNPESIDFTKQISFDHRKCKLCSKCIEYTNDGSISIEEDKLKIDFQLNNNNESLVKICPNDAYSLIAQEYSVDQVVDIILADIKYYENSGGGVTFSGGEAIEHFAFLKECSFIMKKHNINTILDFSGNDRFNKLNETKQFIDSYLLDFKLAPSEKMEEIIGKRLDIEKSLEILYGKSVTLRCPIIPGINDNIEHFNYLSYLKKKYSNIKRVDLLPYHSLKKIYRFNEVIESKTYQVPTAMDKKKWISWIKSLKIDTCYIENKAIKLNEFTTGVNNDKI